MASEVRQAKASTITPLALHVGHVSGVRVDEQMVRIQAAPFVTTMTNHLVPRQRPVLDDPRKTVREMDLSIQADAPITRVVYGGLPDVASGQGIDLHIVGEALVGSPCWTTAPCVPRLRVFGHRATVCPPLSNPYSGRWLLRLPHNEGRQSRFH